MDVPPQDVITRDNVSIKVNAVIYFRVVNANDAVINVENYLYATSQLAQTTLRSVCGQVELDEILSQRGEDQPPTPGDPGPGVPNPGESRFLTSRSSRSICPRR